MLNIKDPRAHDLAREVAAAEGTTLTAAVVSALEQRLELIRRRGAADREARIASIVAASARIREALGSAKPLSDDELYDEYGLPQ